MANEKELKMTQETCEAACRYFDKRQWKYKKEQDGEDLVLTFGVRGDDIPMKFIVAFDADRQLIRLLSMLPFDVSEQSRGILAVATSYVNYMMSDGVFCLDLDDGTICFKYTSSYRNCLIGEELFEYMLDLSITMVDEFNDQFLMLDKGMLTLEDFLQKYSK